MIKRVVPILLLISTLCLSQDIQYSLNRESAFTGDTVKLFYFSKDASRLTISDDAIKGKEPIIELGPGLLILAVESKSLDIDGEESNGVELTLKAYKAAEFLIPPMEITVETQSGFSSTIQVEKTPEVTISFESQLKNKKLSPLLGKITKFDYKKNLPIVFILMLFLLSLYLAKKIYSKASLRTCNKDTKKEATVNIRAEILKLRDGGSTKDDFFRLSTLLKLHIEQKYNFDATKMPSQKILSNLKSIDISDTKLRKAHEAFNSITKPKFADLRSSAEDLNNSIDIILGVVDEL